MACSQVTVTLLITPTLNHRLPFWFYLFLFCIDFSIITICFSAFSIFVSVAQDISQLILLLLIFCIELYYLFFCLCFSCTGHSQLLNSEVRFSFVSFSLHTFYFHVCVCVCVCACVRACVRACVCVVRARERICWINNDFPKPPLCYCFVVSFGVCVCVCVSPCFLSPCCSLPLFCSVLVSFWHCC